MSAARSSILSWIKKDGPLINKSPEFGSALVRVAHKIQSNNSKSQVIKIDGKYFRVKELG